MTCTLDGVRRWWTQAQLFRWCEWDYYWEQMLWIAQGVTGERAVMAGQTNVRITTRKKTVFTPVLRGEQTGHLHYWLDILERWRETQPLHGEQDGHTEIVVLLQRPCVDAMCQRAKTSENKPTQCSVVPPRQRKKDLGSAHTHHCSMLQPQLCSGVRSAHR